MNYFTIKAEYEITTPMFLGDSKQEATSVRMASFKGALVFWWRALNYSRFKAQETSQKAALEAMHSQERKLFGSAKGQGLFLLRVRDQSLQILPKRSLITNGLNKDEVNGACYLGYGVLDSFGADIGKLKRSALAAGSKFEIELIFKSSAKEVQIQEVYDALFAMGLLGGLGSRVRRGWGSISLLGVETSDNNLIRFQMIPETRLDYISALQDLGHSFSKVSGVKFPLTAFAKETDIRVASSISNTGVKALASMGIGFQRYRGWRGMGERSFVKDHDWFKEGHTRNLTNTDLPMRAGLGLPQNYYSRDTPGMVVSGPQGRRGSPLFFHVHKVGATQLFGVMSFFQNLFLPENNDKIRVGNVVKPYEFRSAVITDFLDGNRHVDSGVSVQANNPYFPSVKVFE